MTFQHVGDTGELLRVGPEEVEDRPFVDEVGEAFGARALEPGREFDAGLLAFEPDELVVAITDRHQLLSVEKPLSTT